MCAMCASFWTRKLSSRRLVSGVSGRLLSRVGRALSRPRHARVFRRDSHVEIPKTLCAGQHALGISSGRKKSRRRGVGAARHSIVMSANTCHGILSLSLSHSVTVRRGSAGASARLPFGLSKVRTDFCGLDREVFKRQSTHMHPSLSGFRTLAPF